ncbi:hypothetical protein [Paenibacillus uliginis]|uniref:hypothetical protein n=1 Tax=Paenibacillus uliginis TaxID=683737 RepID=UPI001AD83010|nr:hypothetical protein [Paenibacillus uliginis]
MDIRYIWRGAADRIRSGTGPVGIGAGATRLLLASANSCDGTADLDLSSPLMGVNEAKTLKPSATYTNLLILRMGSNSYVSLLLT